MPQPNKECIHRFTKRIKGWLCSVPLSPCQGHVTVSTQGQESNEMDKVDMVNSRSLRVSKDTSMSLRRSSISQPFLMSLSSILLPMDCACNKGIEVICGMLSRPKPTRRRSRKRLDRSAKIRIQFLHWLIGMDRSRSINKSPSQWDRSFKPRIL